MNFICRTIPQTVNERAICIRSPPYLSCECDTCHLMKTTSHRVENSGGNSRRSVVAETIIRPIIFHIPCIIAEIVAGLGIF